MNEGALQEGDKYKFTKDEYRIYPIDKPIDLINQNWVPLARVVVTEMCNRNKQTSGKYKVVKMYSEEEKEVLTKYWRESVEIKVGQKIDDWSEKIKVS